MSGELNQLWPNDKSLHDLHARKLLEPGWGGEINDIELTYIKAHLQKDNRLRTSWGFPKGERRLTEDGIKAVAMGGDPSDAIHNARLVTQARKTAP